jgi:hypothetical protein
LPTAERDVHRHAGYPSRPNHAVAAIAARCKPDTKCGPFRSRQRTAMAPRLGLDRAGVCARLPGACCAAPRAIYAVGPIRGGSSVPLCSSDRSYCRPLFIESERSQTPLSMQPSLTAGSAVKRTSPIPVWKTALWHAPQDLKNKTGFQEWSV